MNGISMMQCEGNIRCKIDYLSGKVEHIFFKNNVLRTGKIAVVLGLANEENDPFDFYIDQMIFGTNGTSGGTPKFVEETRTGLFGATLLSKNVINSIDSSAPTSLIVTSVVAYDDGVGSTINEMALKMANGQLYSMATFPGIGKTSSMQLTFDWTISML